MTPDQPKRPGRKLSSREKSVREWALENRSAMASIAREFGVSHQFVHMIAYQREGRRSAGMRIERALEERGWPLATGIH